MQTYELNQKQKIIAKENTKKNMYIFGESLKSILQRERRKLTEIPALMEKCINYLSEDGNFEKIGIFRVGPSGKVDKLIAEIEEKKIEISELDFEKIGDVHVIANIVKRFLIKLPETLIPSSLWDFVVDIVHDVDEGEGKEKKKKKI